MAARKILIHCGSDMMEINKFIQKKGLPAQAIINIQLREPAQEYLLYYFKQPKFKS